jgi:hypothetical protein
MPEDRRETGRAVAHWQGRIAHFGYPPLGPADRDFDDLIGEAGAYWFVIGIDRAADEHLLLSYGPQFARLLGLPFRAGANIRPLREIPARLLPSFLRGCRAVAAHMPPVRIEGAVRLRSGRRRLFRAAFMPIGANLVFGAFNSRLAALERREALAPRDRRAERDAIAAFIRRNGVTRCPTAFAIKTLASNTAADREALERYAMALDTARRRALARLFPPGRD